MFVDLLQRGPLHVGANHSNAQEESAILQEKKNIFSFRLVQHHFCKYNLAEFQLSKPLKL